MIAKEAKQRLNAGVCELCGEAYRFIRGACYLKSYRIKKLRLGVGDESKT